MVTHSSLVYIHHTWYARAEQRSHSWNIRAMRTTHWKTLTREIVKTTGPKTHSETACEGPRRDCVEWRMLLTRGAHAHGNYGIPSRGRRDRKCAALSVGNAVSDSAPIVILLYSSLSCTPVGRKFLAATAAVKGDSTKVGMSTIFMRYIIYASEMNLNLVYATASPALCIIIWCGLYVKMKFQYRV